MCKESEMITQTIDDMMDKDNTTHQLIKLIARLLETRINTLEKSIHEHMQNVSDRMGEIKDLHNTTCPLNIPPELGKLKGELDLTKKDVSTIKKSILSTDGEVKKLDFIFTFKKYPWILGFFSLGILTFIIHLADKGWDKLIEFFIMK